MSGVTFTLQPEYGWVILSAVGSIITATVIGGMVAGARKKFGVPYPALYTTDKSKETFNCYQRGHQNMLESHYQIITLLCFAGLQNPVWAASFGGLWSLGRIVYALGYQSGDPAKRNRGAVFIYPSLLGLLFLSCKLATKMLGFF
mmetsp:Transcript_9123/g.10137  ORF Transcript_9123/g.10137 Transcript_9123/m.10137 type:complete len:145 (-) Transcript_9123:88-522(-)